MTDQTREHAHKSRYSPTPRMGVLFVLLSAVFFSLAGVGIKLVPWGALSVSAGRSIFAVAVIYAFMRWQGRSLVVNRAVLLGAFFNFAMSQTFVFANKLTTAANAIVLQFTEPVFAILIMWLVFKAAPNRRAVITCVAVMAGIVCFFLDEISPAGMVGNVLAIVSGLAYAGVFFIKKIPGGCFESASIISLLACFAVGLPDLAGDVAASLAGTGAMSVLPSGPFAGFTCSPLVVIVLLGVLQMGLSYVFLSLGLDAVSPVTASLTSTLEPILSSTIAALMLGEMLGPLSVAGAAMVLGSATVYNLLETKSGDSDTAQDSDAGGTAEIPAMTTAAEGAANAEETAREGEGLQ